MPGKYAATEATSGRNRDARETAGACGDEEGCGGGEGCGEGCSGADSNGSSHTVPTGIGKGGDGDAATTLPLIAD